MTGRRAFLHDATTRMAALSMLGITQAGPGMQSTGEWDFGWTSRIAGKHRAVFDVAEIESGFGVFRAATWASQCIDILGAAPADVSPVIVLRGHAMALALQQTFWDRYDVGRALRVTHPVTGRDTERNPVLLEARDGLPAPLANAALLPQLSRGVTVLACNVALQRWIDAVRDRDRIAPDDARRRSVAALVPGVILQPSGVLAATLAQEHGCSYLRAG